MSSLKTKDGLFIDLVVVYGVDKEIISKENQCCFEAPYESLNVFDEPCELAENYPVLAIDNLKKVNRNHVEANKRKGVNFYTYDDNYKCVLYLNQNMFEKVEELTEEKEYKKGDVSVQYNTLLTFKENIVVVNEMNAKFVKANDPAEPNYYGRIEDIEEVIEDFKTLFKKGSEERIKFYQDKLEQGYKYIIYPITKKNTNQLKIVRYVDHHEKTPERQQLERLIEEIKALNKDWNDYEIEKLLNNYNVTRK